MTTQSRDLFNSKQTKSVIVKKKKKKKNMLMNIQQGIEDAQI